MHANVGELVSASTACVYVSLTAVNYASALYILILTSSVVIQKSSLIRALIILAVSLTSCGDRREEISRDGAEVRN